ncbi:MAG: hypothetical protein SFT92_00890 [Rickettsiales bacterium]|nr:hypothetical protein [Rickettsiales bacterium]
MRELVTTKLASLEGKDVEQGMWSKYAPKWMGGHDDYAAQETRQDIATLKGALKEIDTFQKNHGPAAAFANLPESPKDQVKQIQLANQTSTSKVTGGHEATEIAAQAVGRRQAAVEQAMTV